MDNNVKPGDSVTVECPTGPGAAGAANADLRQGVVKFVTPSGRIHWYCVGILCGQCGPNSDQGHHRVGMAGSRIVDF